MTIEDAQHYSPEQRAAIVASYPEHERDARARGIPALGSGRVFPLPDESAVCPAFAIPAHWPLIGGLDFGWDHPTAAVRLAWDRDADAVYVTHSHRLRRATPIVHSATLRAWGARLPWAWPQDGLQHDKGTGRTLAELFRHQGLAMLPDHATFPDGGTSLEAGILEMLERLESSRLKVFAHLESWLEEFRFYHRRDGRVVKERDDLLAATRYALMMLRHARPAERSRNRARAETDYDIFGG